MDTGAALQGSSGTVRAREVTVIGFTRRLLATVYDGLLLVFLTFLVACAFGIIGLFVQMYNPNEPLPMDRIIILSSLVLSALYYIGMWATSGQTIGKTATGMRIVSVDGSRLTWGKAIIRYLGYIISGVLLSLGFLWIVFDPRRQGLHDKLAGTLVVESDDEELLTAGGAVNFVPSDPGNVRWTWVALWLIFALVAPWGLFGGLWILGPAMNRLVTGWVQGLR
jgi:uncharacterized RDD family membrane protein YckC